MQMFELLLKAIQILQPNYKMLLYKTHTGNSTILVRQNIYGFE